MILKTINITLYTHVGKPGEKKIIIRYLDQLQVHTPVLVLSLLLVPSFKNYVNVHKVLE